MSLDNLGRSPQYVVFGDSLTDTGNFLAALDGLVDTSGLTAITGEDGTMSDGATWTEVLASEDLRGLITYSVSGAGAIGGETLLHYLWTNGITYDFLVDPNDPALTWDMNLTAQIDRFQADLAEIEARQGSAPDLSQVTAIVQVGAGDYDQLWDQLFTLPGEDLFTYGARIAVQSVAYTLQQAWRLDQMGLEDVFVANLPETSFYPAVDGLNAPPLPGTGLPGIITLHNDLLEAGIAALNARGADIELLDFALISAALADDPGMWNREDVFYDETGGPFSWAGGDNVIDFGIRAFWDGVHMTVSGNATLADMAQLLRDNRGDLLGGTDAADALGQSDGAFVALTLGGDDSVQGSAGGDWLFLGSGDDAALGDAGNDMMLGGAGDDTLLGEAGDDLFFGGDGDDILMGGAGEDDFLGGRGADLMLGGAGDDQFILMLDYTDFQDHWDARDTIIGGDGHDEIIIHLGLGDGPYLNSPESVLRVMNIEVQGIEDIHVVAFLDDAPALGSWIYRAFDLHLVSDDGLSF